MDIQNKNFKSSVNFELRATGHIYLVFRYRGKRLRIYTKEKLTKELWDADKQKARDSNKNPSANKTNESLNDMESTIKRLYRKFSETYERTPEPKELLNAFNNEYFEKIPQFTTAKQKTLIEVFNEYIEKKRIDNTESTAIKYQQALDNLNDFGRASNLIIDFANIDMSFRNKFVRYLQEVKGYSNSTIYRKMKFVKTILIYALDNRYTKGYPMNLKNFLTKDEAGTHIALSELELDELENLDLSDNPRLDKVRDRFLIGCYTGLRFSDFIRLNKNHIEDGKYIKITMQKTNRSITIPFRDNVKRIFVKYGYNLPKPISEPNFNEYLKEVTRQCETLKRFQEVRKTIGGKEQKTKIQRCELTTSHTARRTFVTINHARGIDLDTLTIATGHTSVKALKTYVKLDNNQKADLLAKAFNRANQKEDQKQETKIINISGN